VEEHWLLRRYGATADHAARALVAARPCCRLAPQYLAAAEAAIAHAGACPAPPGFRAPLPR